MEHRDVTMRIVVTGRRPEEGGPMIISTRNRMAVAAVLALASGACATSNNVFTRHESDMAERALREATADRTQCPVIVANGTEEMLEVEYRAGSLREEVGLLPSGQRASFDVPCSLETVRGYGTVALGGAWTPHREFETRARLDRTRAAVLHFTEMHAVR
jgi:hypothetical protein